MLTPIRWTDHALELLDQRKLPDQELWIRYSDVEDVAQAITDMVVRGAPAIGITAAFGMALALRDFEWDEEGDQRVRGGMSARQQEAMNRLFRAGDRLKRSRPTAFNLTWAVSRQLELAAQCLVDSPERLYEQLLDNAREIHAQDIKNNMALGAHGAALLQDGDRVLTHCNAGALATGGYGTALGVIRAAFESDKNLQVFACETRPYLQGARLTAWELVHSGIPVCLIVDSAAAYLMHRGEVDCVVVGADRIAANGDVANKIGTYGLALAARENGIPFYVAAPQSTLDREIPDGEGIEVEIRSPEEVTHFQGERITPEMVEAFNIAFDVTPAEHITAIIMETGVYYPPFVDQFLQQSESEG